MKILLTMFLAATLATVALCDLVPDLITAQFYRTNAVASVSSDSYYKGSTVRFTNCVAYASGGATQDLTSVAVLVRIGDSSTNLQSVLSAMIATNGTFAGNATIPAVGGTSMRVQLRLTNSTTLYIYPPLEINVQAPL